MIAALGRPIGEHQRVGAVFKAGNPPEGLQDGGGEKVKLPVSSHQKLHIRLFPQKKADGLGQPPLGAQRIGKNLAPEKADGVGREY